MRRTSKDAASPAVVAFELTVPADAEEDASVVLWDCGTSGIEVRAGGAGQSVLLAYFEPSDDLESRLRRALQSIPGARVESVPVPEVDWVARFRAGFRPLLAGGFRIVPCWDVPARSATPMLVVEP